MPAKTQKRLEKDEREMTLDEWLTLATIPARQSPYSMENYQFPTDEHREQYLLSVSERSEIEVRNLLRNFIVSSMNMGADRENFKSLMAHSAQEIIRQVNENEYIRRLVRRETAWEGVTWLLDLLPHYPGKAIEVLNAYDLAHCQSLPDGRARGLDDAEAIIRARYLHWGNSRAALLDLRPREFELLIGALFHRMGYKVSLTQASRDGGIDIIARHLHPGNKAINLIQCKCYEGRITVKTVRELHGVVASRQANKGIIVTTSDFTRPARKEAAENAMIELIDFTDLNKLLNKHLGSQWPAYISHHIRFMEHRLALPDISKQ